MGTPFDKLGIRREAAENLSNILSKRDRSAAGGQTIAETEGIFVDVILGEIVWARALGHPAVPDHASAFTIRAGLRQFAFDYKSRRWLGVDAPIYRPHWWSRLDEDGNPSISFLIAGVTENSQSNLFGTSKDGLTRTFVEASLVSSVRWKVEGGIFALPVLGRRVIADSRREFFKVKGAQHMRFEVTAKFSFLKPW